MPRENRFLGSSIQIGLVPVGSSADGEGVAESNVASQANIGGILGLQTGFLTMLIKEQPSVFLQLKQNMFTCCSE